MIILSTLVSLVFLSSLVLARVPWSPCSQFNLLKKLKAIIFWGRYFHDGCV